MGGNVASMYAGIRPKRTRWLVNVEGVGLKRTVPEAAPEHYAEWLDHQREPARARRYNSIETVINFILSRNPAMPRERAEFLARAWTEPAGDGVMMGFDPRHRRTSALLFRREEAEACWRRIEAPVMLFLADQSEILPRIAPDGSDEYFHSLYRDLRILHVADAGHMMHLEVPELLARHIVEFASTR